MAADFEPCAPNREVSRQRPLPRERDEVRGSTVRARPDHDCTATVRFRPPVIRAPSSTDSSRRERAVLTNTRQEPLAGSRLEQRRAAMELDDHWLS
jgi:hypothetical protein